MRRVRLFPALLLLPALSAWAQQPSAAPFSSSALVAARAPSGGGGQSAQTASAYSTPFSGLAIGVKVGLLGPGVEIATPLARTVNLRGGANYFSYSDTFTSDGITYNATLRFLSGEASVDWFPWAKGFHISGGALVYNGNQITGNASVPGGQTFTLNHVTYESSTTDPVSGTGSLAFRKAAPKVSFGWGNLLPRSGRHWSIPFELGFAYVGDPKVALNLTGTVCDTSGANCRTIASDPTVQANVTAQQQKLASDANPARFYPILSVGFGFAF
ncbi:MAG: hypothetical protein WCA44_10525 [Acidobacteriaceae bacterium]